MGKKLHALGECPVIHCRKQLQPENAATNFKSPTLSVKLAIEKQLLKSEHKILEIGAGNLRNALYILKCFPKGDVSVFELKATINRFRDRYEKFRRLGGHLINCEYGSLKYDAVICTFVLETICPFKKRTMVLKNIRRALKNRGLLIISLRGYPGVRGSRYKQCPKREGLITPFNTFVKPYSISEVHKFLGDCGFKHLFTFQKYRVDKPENIHIMAVNGD